MVRFGVPGLGRVKDTGFQTIGPGSGCAFAGFKRFRTNRLRV